jgi:hypothetical protein
VFYQLFKYFKNTVMITGELVILDIRANNVPFKQPVIKGLSGCCCYITVDPATPAL